MIAKPKFWQILTAATLISSTFISIVTLNYAIADNKPSTTQVSKAILTLSGHTAPLRTIVISPDGQTLASGGDDKTIKLWHLQTGQLLRTLTGHTENLTSLVFSPDGKTLVSSSYDKTIKLWNVQTGKLIRNLSGHSAPITSIAISPNGQILASSSHDKTIKLWNLSNGKLVHSFKVLATAVVISPDGQTLISGHEDGIIKLWNLYSRKLITNLVPPKPKNPTYDFQRASSVTSLAISADGKTLINGGYDDSHMSIQETDGKNIKVWNLKTGKVIHNLSTGIGSVDAVLITPDGKSFISGGLGSQISIFNLETGKLIRTLEGHAGGIYGLAVSQDGKTLISGSGDKSIKVWRL
ncbi:WD40 repeat domain-containing protein [Okeanomitos corallinicola TIOX110]|uniref:WD40 repeat domain-containing protein n=1 Tax=Okeanomitos corallinicola TIOX110 TaxID=3133117 RepID=A0ABZ2UMF1_9CYAN